MDKIFKDNSWQDYRSLLETQIFHTSGYLAAK